MPRIGYSGQGTYFRRLLNNAPQLSAAYWELRKTLNEGVLAPKLRMLSFLSSDLVNHCRYWLRAHTVAGRALGITQEMVEAIEKADASPLFTDQEKAAIAASLELTRTATLSDATFKRVRPFFDDRALIELVVNTSIANLNNRVTDAFVADVEDEE